MIITRDEARNMIPILQAFAEGKDIEMWNGLYDKDYDYAYMTVTQSGLLPLTHLLSRANIDFNLYYRVKGEKENEQG